MSSPIANFSINYDRDVKNIVNEHGAEELQAGETSCRITLEFSNGKLVTVPISPTDGTRLCAAAANLNTEDFDELVAAGLKSVPNGPRG
jgi:hypothetical protein